MLANGDLKADTVQERAVAAFEVLAGQLADYHPSSVDEVSGWRRRLGLVGGGVSKVAQPAPRGLYLFGPVGRGKSMLMDLFFRAAPIEAKRRVHFQVFMRDFHAALHKWRMALTASDDADPIPPLAAALARQSRLLCLDELEVRDIADAMIIGRVFEYLFKEGVVIVVTSNRPPDDLYKDGLQREKFLPFIRMTKERLDLIELASPTDYRLGRLQGAAVYYAPLGEKSRQAIDEVFQRLADHRPIHADIVTVSGRAVMVPSAVGDIARFSFHDLCEQPLGAADYIEITGHYATVVLTEVPKLGPENRDAARRFVMLVDALYESHTVLILSADAPPETLYPSGDGAFEFQRTVSRLMEMQSLDYLSTQANPQKNGD